MVDPRRLPEELVSHVPDSLWTDSPNADTGSLRWAPLERVTDSGIWMGLTHQGYWAIGRPSTSANSIEYGVAIAWLTLLELDPGEFREKLKAIGARLGVEGKEKELAAALPVGDVIYMARNWLGPLRSCPI